jgi:2-methylcitrate dehydratase PrpD
VANDLEDAGDSLTAQLVRATEAQPVTSEDLRVCSLLVLDALAGIIGARTAPLAEPILAWATYEPMTTGRRAMALGALSNILEMDAMHQPSGVHPGTVVVPAAVAVAMHEKTTAGQFLIAVLRGTQAAARIGRAAGPGHFRTYQATSTCGVFGAALGAAVLLKLDLPQTVSAMGNAASNAGGLWQFLDEGSLTKQWHAGRAAEAGVVSAQLAARGLTGPRRILEGRKGFFRAMCPDAKPDELFRNSDDWEVADVSFKPWPSPRPTHPAIDAALRAAPQIRDRAIGRVELDTYPAAVDLCNQPEASTEHAARFSLRFCVAAALRDGRIDFGSFQRASRERNAALCARVTVAATERFADAFPRACGAEVRVFLMDGSVIRSVREHAKGDPAAPLTESEVVSKALGLLELGNVENPRRFVDDVLAMRYGGAMPLAELRRTFGEVAECH